MNNISIDQNKYKGYVEVILPVYHKNNVREITDALESLFNQSYSKIFIVIVIDGIVKDDITNYLNKFTHLSNYKIIQIPKNLGLAKVLNIAIKKSKCEYIARMDADDISLKDRILKQVEFMEKNFHIDVLGTSIYEKYGEKYIYSGLPSNHEQCYKLFSIQNPVFHPTVLFRKIFFQKAGYYPEVDSTTEDSLMWLKGFNSGVKFANLKEPLYVINIDKTLLKRRSSVESIINEYQVRMKINKECKFGFYAYLFILTKSILLLLTPIFIIRFFYMARAKISSVLLV